MEFNTIINGLLEKRIKLDPATIKAQLLSKEEVAEYNARRKELIKSDKIAAFKAQNCTIEYKGRLLDFNPVSTITEDGTRLVIWKNATANGYLVCFANAEGNCELKLVARVIETNKYIEYKKELLKKEQRFVIGIFNDVIEGLKFDDFARIVTLYRKHKDIECPKCLRGFKTIAKKSAKKSDKKVA